MNNGLENLRKHKAAHRKKEPTNNMLLTNFKNLREKFELAIKKTKVTYYWKKFKKCNWDSRQKCMLLNLSRTQLPNFDSYLKVKEKTLK